MMNYTRLISVVAFAVLFFTALFLFMRNYPSDRWFSIVFVVAGGVLLWGGDAAADAVDAGEANKYENTTSNTIDTNDNMNKIEGINGVSDNIVDETTNQRE